MLKKIILSVLCLTNVLYANDYQKKLFDLLDLKQPLKREDYQTLKDFMKLLVWQEEFIRDIGPTIEKGTSVLKALREVDESAAKIDFLEKMKRGDAEGWGITLSNISNSSTAMALIRYKNFLEKTSDFSDADLRLAESLATGSDNPEIKLMGEFKKNIIISDLAKDTFAEMLDILLYGMHRDIHAEYNKIPKVLLDKIIFLFKPSVDIAHSIKPDDPIMNQIIQLRKLQNLHLEIKKNYQIDLLYQAARNILASAEDPQKLLLKYKNLDGKTRIFPLSLDAWEEVPVPIEPPTIKKKKISKKKKPKKKTIAKKQPQKKPRVQAAPEVILEPLPEEEQLPQIDVQRNKFQELIAWYTNQFPVHDGSSIIHMNDYQIMISDPKNNAEIILFRKSQDDEKIISDPLNYDDRVELWFENPQEALEVGGYTQKYDSIKKLKEFETRHNFAKITDAFLDKEGISTQFTDRQGNEIPVKLLAGELRLKQPDGSVEKISGIFSYGRIPGADRYYHRYFSDKEYKDIVQEYFSKSKWEVEFPPLGS